MIVGGVGGETDTLAKVALASFVLSCEQATTPANAAFARLVVCAPINVHKVAGGELAAVE